MQIVTSRLLLRDFTPDDVSAVHTFDADPELARYRGGGRVTEEDTSAFIQRTQHWLQSEPSPIYALAFLLREQAEMIGIIGLTITERDLGEAELWYRLSRKHWKQGYTTEAACAMLSFGFTDLHLHRIAATRGTSWPEDWSPFCNQRLCAIMSCEYSLETEGKT